MLNRFIPFLREKKISRFDAVTALVLADFQDPLLAGGVRPQTANNKLKAVKRVFAYAARKGIITENPCERLKYIPVRQSDQEARGCYELEKLKGAFDKRWEDGTSYALCLLAYATGMRNGEIRRLRKSDIVSIDGRRFIDIKESKTPSGIRLVPLHDYVRRELEAYGSRSEAGDLLFEIRGYETFSRANLELARKLGVSETELKAERISFYSGRHFWKTLMNSEGLGEDVEEIFMGHKVSSNVAKRYNHRDKQGKEIMLRKAEQVFDILDRRLFGKPGAEARP